MRAIKRYHRMLQKIDGTFPDPFPLESLLKDYASQLPSESGWMPEKFRTKPKDLPGAPEGIKDYLKDATEPQDKKPGEKPQDKQSGDSKA